MRSRTSVGPGFRYTEIKLLFALESEIITESPAESRTLQRRAVSKLPLLVQMSNKKDS